MNGRQIIASFCERRITRPECACAQAYLNRRLRYLVWQRILVYLEPSGDKILMKCIDLTSFDCASLIGMDFQGCFDSVQTETDRAKWKSEQHAEKMFSGRTFVPPRIVV